MNMLIIGNGFDIAHGLPTTYSDFLTFLKLMLRIQNSDADERADVEEYLDSAYDDLCPAIREYLLSTLETKFYAENGCIRSSNNLIQELYDCLDKNVWYKYFQIIYRENEIHGKNWIDFEGEIREVIEYFDHTIDNIYGQWLFGPSSSKKQPNKISYFREKMDFSAYNQINHKDRRYINTYYDLIEKSYQDLEKLIRCLEIYLDDCVGKIPITQYSPDIEQIGSSPVLSFNYTAVPTDIYPLLKSVHYVHGRADASRLAEKNDMVLGVNEYWDDSEKDFRTNFNCYKKFVQRIIKETGIEYKKALQIVAAELDSRKKVSNIYIFGHSLDVTDGDILREIIRTPGVVTTIFYRNKQQQSNQISNLSKVLGQDELLARVFSTSPTIIFKQQADMKKL